MQRFASHVHRLISRPVVQVTGGVSLLVFTWFELRGRNDLDIFLAASSALFEGKNIYHDLYFGAFHYYYSLLFATIIHPLTTIPPWAAKLLFLIANYCLIYRIGQLMIRELKAPWFNAALRSLFLVVLTIAGMRFLRGNMHFGQVTIFILWASLESIFLIRRGQPIAGGSLLALAINIKLLPLVFIPYLIWRKHLRSLYTVLIALLTFFVRPAAWLGLDHWWFLTREWIALINPAEIRHIIDTSETSFHSLTSLLPSLLLERDPDNRALPISRNILSIHPHQIKWVLLGARCVLIALTLWFLRTPPFQRARGTMHAWWEVSYLLLVIPLIFPHQLSYAFLLTMPALAWVIYHLMEKWITSGARPGIHEWIAVGLVVLTFNLSLWLGPFNEWYNHFKIVTWGTILLLVLLALYRPGKESSILN